MKTIETSSNFLSYLNNLCYREILRQYVATFSIQHCGKARRAIIKRPLVGIRSKQRDIREYILKHKIVKQNTYEHVR